MVHLINIQIINNDFYLCKGVIMVLIKPFHGIVLNREKISDFSKVITQPYDKISPEMQEQYYAAHPNNVVRIIKGKELPIDNEQDNVYTRANTVFQEWLSKDILVRHKCPTFFYLEQTYTLDNITKTRKGLMIMGRLEPYTQGVIFPHEQTLKGPKIDRLNLFRATNASFGQVFMLYNDPHKIVDSTIQKSKSAPYCSFVDADGVTNTFYAIEANETLMPIIDYLKDKPLFIADGHHRYETALTFENEMAKKYPKAPPNAAFHYAMMTLINMDDEGLTVLPTHRLLKNIPEFSGENLLASISAGFSIEQLTFDENNIDQTIARLQSLLKQKPKPSFALFLGDIKKLVMITLENPNLIASLKNKSSIMQSLDVAILHDGILEPLLGINKKALADQCFLDYRRNAKSCLEMTMNKTYQAAFILKATRAEQVRNVALNHETMPQKSTDFYPKVLTGFVMADISISQELI